MYEKVTNTYSNSILVYGPIVGVAPGGAGVGIWRKVVNQSIVFHTY